MKELINTILGHFGYIIKKNKSNYFQTGDLLFPFAQSLISTMKSEDFMIVQIGANLGMDGNLNDPVKKFIQNNPNIKGVLVEPMLEYLDIVKKIYARNSNLNFENIAIGKEKGELKLLRFKPGVNYAKDYYDGLATLKQNRIEDLKNRAKKDNTELYLEEIKVPVFTAQFLKEKYEISKIDLLQVDTEGFDFIVVNSFFSAGFFPTLINFEYTELTVKEYQAVINLILNNSYKLYQNGADILAVSNNCSLFN